MITICKAKTRSSKPCTKKSTYGVLCSVHASQLVNCSTVYQENKVKRLHMVDLTIMDIDEVKMYYLAKHPYSPYLSTNPMSYRVEVLEYLNEVGEAPVKSIVAHLNKKTKHEMTGRKIGQLMRVMMLEGTVARKHVCIDGHGVSVYALNRVLGSIGGDDELEAL